MVTYGVSSWRGMRSQVDEGNRRVGSGTPHACWERAAMARQANTGSSTASSGRLSDGGARRVALVLAVAEYSDVTLRRLRSPAGLLQRCVRRWREG